MKRPIRFVLFAAFLFAFTCPTHGQQRRAVTVVTTEDKKHEGVFIRADEAGVIIQDGDAQITLKLESVKLIMFGGPAPAPLPTPDAAKDKETEAARRAIRALRKLDNASNIGVSYVNYTPMVVEAKTEVDEAVGQIQTWELKDLLRASMAEYELAARVWQASWRDGNITNDNLKSIAVERYGVKKHGLLRVVWRDEFLSAIWDDARKFLNRAAALVEKKPPEP